MEIIGNVLSWASDLEPNTFLQAQRASRMPFVAGHVALMPDAHVGIGATVGSVIPTKGAIIPAAVGVDIGCGMIAQNTGLMADQLPTNLDSLMPLIEERIPAGFSRGKDRQAPDVAKLVDVVHREPSPRVKDLWSKAITQFGSLGSGNHFVEVCLDENESVWLVLHSGSRGVGNKVATWHIGRAKKAMKQYFISLEDPDLAYFVENTPPFGEYIEDMHWCQDYAFENRQQMMNAAIRSLFEVCGNNVGGFVAARQEVINCHHNYTVRENHHGKNIWLTRKGAIKAGVGDLGVIPGSMGASSFIVKGLGNPASYNSSAHGAGRRMSRRQAKEQLTAEGLTALMGDRTWNSGHAQGLVDEHPEAYKPIEQVMADQADLVSVVHTLHQVFNYKGT